MGRSLRVCRRAVCVLAVAVVACADEARTGVVVEGGVIAAPVMEGPAAMYLSIANTGPTADTLIALGATGGRSATIHRQVTGGDLLVRMEPLAELEIPGLTTISMEPGGLHVMLEGEGQLTPGDTIAIELTFRRAGSLTVRAPVVPYQELQEKLASRNAPRHH